MREYNSIEFRTPQKKKFGATATAADDHQHQEEPTTTTTSNRSSFNRQTTDRHHNTAATTKTKTTTAAAVGGSHTSTAVTAGSSSVPPSPPSDESNHRRHPPHDDTGVTMSSSRQQQHFHTNGGGSSPIPTQQQMKQSLSPADALALRREGPEGLVLRLRRQLEESEKNSGTSKAATAKADAVALELRSQVRQLKRQLQYQPSQQQQVSSPRQEDSHHHKSTSSNSSTVGELQLQLDRAHAQILTADMVRKELEDTLEAEQYTWELRFQDQERAISELQHHADTLQQDLDRVRSQWKEAETGWAKDVQHLRDELTISKKDAVHWKSAATTTTTTDTMNGKHGGGDSSDLQQRLIMLEQERTELQTCLDEALKELEAVDAELQHDNAAELRDENEQLREQLEKAQQQQRQRGSVGDDDDDEALKHLYRWVMERDGGTLEQEHDEAPGSAQELVDAIQAHLEDTTHNGDRERIVSENRVEDLEAQIKVLKGDLKAREESSAELRASLKEAVALLKPLQDSVAKGDKERTKLQTQLEKTKSEAENLREETRKYKKLLNEKDDEIENLKQEIESMEFQLSKAKLAVMTNSVASRSVNDNDSQLSPDSVTKTREELRAKRQSEKTLKTLLRDAQQRFNSLHRQNQEVEAMNSELQGRLRDAEDSLDIQPSGDTEERIGNPENLQTKVREYERRMHELENEASILRGELAKKDIELRRIKDDLQDAKSNLKGLGESDDHEKVRKAEERVRDLEADLSEKSEALASKKEAERALNKSLSEALGLIKPLQRHLEEAEEEKRDLMEELEAVRRQATEMSMNGSRSSNSDIKLLRELEITVRQLEKENSQLQDALEDMSQSLNASQLNGPSPVKASEKSQLGKSEAKLREEIVELKSRYEVTQKRLHDAFVENRTLVEALQKREAEESDLLGEVNALREKLDEAESELENSKFIATSALVKVDELTLENIEERSFRHEGERSFRNEGDDSLYRAKARELDRELEKVRKQRGGRKQNRLHEV